MYICGSKKGPLFSGIYRISYFYLVSIMKVKNASFSQLLKTYRIALYTAPVLKRWFLCVDFEILKGMYAVNIL